MISSAISSNIYIILVHSNLWSLVILTLSIFGVTKTISFSDIYAWIIDMIKEFKSSYELLIDVYIIVFLIVIISEILFFIDMFFIMLILLWSVMWSLSGFYFSDPNKLSFSNTIVLSCTSLWVIIYSISFIYSYGFLCSYYNFYLVINIFIDVQCYDFNNYNMYFNDFIFGLYYYIITGLHLLHLMLGKLVAGVSLFYIICSVNAYVYDWVMYVWNNVYIFISLQLVYWHFLEMLWIFIYLAYY